jgi:glutamate/tyrosine decarboxylase-like PLP-dependent enzyme
MHIGSYLSQLKSRLVGGVADSVISIPVVRKRVDKEIENSIAGLADDLKPYRDEFISYEQLPANGRAYDDILLEMAAIKAREESRWQDGYASGAVYHGGSEHINFLNQVYTLYSQSNPLHADLWPSASKFEAEIISMTGTMLGAKETNDEISGSVSSGGTESILLAMKSYRDQARDIKGITQPEMIVPLTAHAAFDKAAEYFNIKMVRVPVNKDYRADVTAVRNAINKNSVVIVGSAPTFPHGMIDPIAEMSALALDAGIGFHTDACLGGFVLPWAEKLGAPVPPYDFRLPGVTSISADTHKYGYAAKGTSVVLYRTPELRHYQYFVATDWPGGLYFSPTFAGSRPGALSAACWAAMVSIGEAGYMEATERILETAMIIKEGIISIPELKILGDPLWVIAFASETLDIYKIMDWMTHKGWSLNGLHKPSCVHIAVTQRHTQPGVAGRFIVDLKEAVTAVKADPEKSGGMAPVYGLAATLPARGVVGDILKRYIDLLYET